MTSMNGAHHHNVEDILASIHTSIADEAGHTRHINAELHAPGSAASTNGVRREMPVAEEVPDFELPAIFKPTHASPAEKPKLLDRLSEALKHANMVEANRIRTVSPYDPASSGSSQHASVPHHQPAPVAHAPHQPEPARYDPVQPGSEVKRVMPTFFDTRVNKLGELTRQAYKPPAPEPAPYVQPQPQLVRQPPTLPQGNLPQAPANVMDDAAAQLLRPMLRQWLQENMPKIVEKALLSEVQGDEQPPSPGKPQR